MFLWGLETGFAINGQVHLRNKFHFSEVHGAINRSGSYAK